MSWTRSPLQSRMGKQKVIVELRMSDIVVDNSASWTIPCAVSVTSIGREESCVMTFCDDDEGDVWTVTFLESFAGRTNCFDFGFDDMSELTFGNTVTEE